MKVLKYIQIIQVGYWNNSDRWTVLETFKDAETLKKYHEELEKDDIRFFRGVYTSPRIGQFCIKYRFCEESEE